MFEALNQKGCNMNQIDPEIVKLYVLTLKYSMKIKDVPRAWLNVEKASKSINPDYKMKKVPGFINMIMNYCIKKG